MIRKFRAIVQTSKEPQDHEVLWYWKGKLLFWSNGDWEPLLLVDAIEIPYETEEDESITTVQGALDKLMYTIPEITSFTLKEAGTYERGTIISTLTFSWDYNKKLIKQQKIDDVSIPSTVREVSLKKIITTDTAFTLWCNDGTTQTSATTSIKFVDYIYYGKEGEPLSRFKVDTNHAEFTLTLEEGEHAYIFIPNSSGLTRIWCDNKDQTDAFILRPIKDGYLVDTGLHTIGKYYVSKNSGLGTITLKFT